MNRRVSSSLVGRYNESHLDPDERMKIYLTKISLMKLSERHSVKDEFINVLYEWIRIEERNIYKANYLLPQLLELYPDDNQIIWIILNTLCQIRDFSLISRCIELCDMMLINTLPVERSSAYARTLKCNLISLPFSQWHMRMINDANRNYQYLKALEHTAKGKSVLDIGTGTGLLAVYAHRFASKVEAIEENGALCDIAEKVFRKNDAIVELIHANSKRVIPTSNPDVICSEILDACLFGEFVVDVMIDAHQRFAHSSTIFIPANAKVFVRLLSCPSIYSLHAKDVNGKKFRSEYVRCASNYTPSDPYWCCNLSDFEDVEFLSDSMEVADVDFNDLDSLESFMLYLENRKIECTNSGTLHAFSVHFTANLTVDGAWSIDTSKNTCWDSGIFPLADPIDLKKGDFMDVVCAVRCTRFEVFDPNMKLDETYTVLSFEEFGKLRDDLWMESILDSIPPSCSNNVLDLSEMWALKTLRPNSLVNQHGKSNFDTIVASCKRHDGSFDNETLLKLKGAIISLNNIKSVIPARLRITGRLFSSEKINREARPRPASYHGVNLEPFYIYSLQEYRDIHEEQRKDFIICSDDFEIINCNMLSLELIKSLDQTKLLQISTYETARNIDGVLYSFEVDGKENCQTSPMSAFLFPERIVNHENIVKLIIDFYECELLISQDTS